MRKPNLFIVGKAKSGTTALHCFLSQHPQIYMSPAKEPKFFCKDITEEIYSRRKGNAFPPYKDESNYLSLFAAVKNEKIIGESSPHYLYSEMAAQEIFNFNPDAKIIIMLRDPVSFLYSYHSQLFANGVETVEDFGTALSLENQRKRGMNIPITTNCPSDLFYSERVKYYEQVIRYYNLFDKSQIKVIIYDDFKKNNEAVYKDILRFLGVDTNFISNFYQVNVNEVPRSIKLNFWIRRWATREPLIKKIIQHSVSPVFYENIKQNLRKKILLKKKPRRPLNTALRKNLMAKYKREVTKISEFLGIDLVKRWNYDRLPEEFP